MQTKILAINAGSSSLKFQLFAMPQETTLCQGIVERIGLSDARFTLKYSNQYIEHILSVDNHQQAVELIVHHLLEVGVVSQLDEISGVGHRVAHGGEVFHDSALIDERALTQIEQLCELAPLHNPVNLVGIRAFMNTLPLAKAVAVFDTSFHHTLAAKDYLYPIPYEYYQRYHIRRYGFHGTSHKYVSQAYANACNTPLEQLNLITCHLGNGSSLCAIEHGRSIQTSMGFTPLAGVMMGTRCGDIDPSILPFLAEKESLSASDLNTMINQQSGLFGVSGLSHDCRDLQQAAEQGNQRAALALEMFIERVRAFIGQYLVKLGHVDAIIFTGGIGENAAAIREKICTSLQPLNILIDVEKNRATSMIISRDESPITLAVIATNEELMIAKDVMRIGL